MWVVLIPTPLSCDWSYPALPPISSLADPRIPALCAYIALCLAGAFWAALTSTRRPRALMCVATGLLPFVLASNLLTVVGTAEAERLLYLPSLGGCMGIALGLAWQILGVVAQVLPTFA